MGKKRKSPDIPGWPGLCPETPSELAEWLRVRIRWFDAIVESPKNEGDWSDPAAVRGFQDLCGEEVTLDRRWLDLMAEQVILLCHKWRGYHGGVAMPDLPDWVPIKTRPRRSPAEFAREYLTDRSQSEQGGDVYEQAARAEMDERLKTARADLGRLLKAIDRSYKPKRSEPKKPGRRKKDETKQRADFAAKKLGEGMNWREIREEYVGEHPDDSDASTDAIRQAHSREYPAK